MYTYKLCNLEVISSLLVSIFSLHDGMGCDGETIPIMGAATNVKHLLHTESDVMLSMGGFFCLSIRVISKSSSDSSNV